MCLITLAVISLFTLKFKSIWLVSLFALFTKGLIQKVDRPVTSHMWNKNKGCCIYIKFGFNSVSLEFSLLVLYRCLPVTTITVDSGCCHDFNIIDGNYNYIKILFFSFFCAHAAKWLDFERGHYFDFCDNSRCCCWLQSNDRCLT